MGQLNLFFKNPLFRFKNSSIQIKIFKKIHRESFYEPYIMVKFPFWDRPGLRLNICFDLFVWMDRWCNDRQLD